MAELQPTQPDDQAPKVVDEYVILDRLGSGGMGTVYRALHQRLQRTVAIKLLSQKLTEDKASVSRFLREMAVVGKVDHPHIVQALDAGVADGVHFLVMECIEGLNLNQLLRRDGCVPLSDACEIIRQTALGLQHLYEHGLVHRDIKMSNLMLTRDGRVKILDLGLACLQRTAAGEDEITASGYILGTADYMPPEQARDARLADQRSDIYSLGCTFFALLTGATPFAGAAHGVVPKIRAHADLEFPALPDEFPDGIRRILHRMVAKSAADRYATPKQLVSDLDSWCFSADLLRLAHQSGAILPDGSPTSVVTTAIGSANPSSPPARRRLKWSVPWLLTPIFFVIVLTGILISTWLLFRPEAKLESADGGPKNDHRSPLPTAAGASPVKQPRPAPTDLPVLTVREVTWPREHKTSTWEIMEGGEDLRFFCEGTGLLEFVDVPEDDYTFSGEFRRTEWRENTGFYLSFRRIKRLERDGHDGWFQFLHLFKTVDGATLLSRYSCPHPADDYERITETPLNRSPVEVNLNAPHRIGWQVENGSLLNVQFNGRQIAGMNDEPTIVLDKQATHAKGRVGLYVHRASGVVGKIILNGNPVRLIAFSENAR